MYMSIHIPDRNLDTTSGQMQLGDGDGANAICAKRLIRFLAKCRTPFGWKFMYTLGETETCKNNGFVLSALVINCSVFG